MAFLIFCKKNENNKNLQNKALDELIFVSLQLKMQVYLQNKQIPHCQLLNHKIYTIVMPMKKILSFATLMLAFACLSWAYDFSAVASSGQTLYYDIIGETVSVTYPGADAYNPYSGYTHPTGALTIPSTVDYNSQTYSVTTINRAAFYGCDGLISVTIPNSITSIGNSAFFGCTSLTSATIPDSVTSIGSSVFEGCTGLTNVNIPTLVTTIPGSAFSGCSGLTSVTIPHSVTYIGGHAFSDCSGLTSVVFNATECRTMGSSNVTVFAGCTNLTSLTIGENVTKIPNYAFYGCSGITHITIPENVESIGLNAFYWENDGLTVQFNATHCNEDYMLGANIYYPFAPKSVRNFIFGNNVQYIPSYICWKDTLLTEIEIPNSVTTIGYWAFMDCTGLTSVTIGNSVTSIPYSAFSGCTGLTSVTIPHSVTFIGTSAFLGCTGLTSVTIPNSVTDIGTSAFYGCTGLTSVTIGSGVNTILNGAFAGCNHLAAITCMAAVPPEIGDTNAFEGVWKGLPLTVPNGSVSQYQIAYGWREFTNIIGSTGIEETRSEYEIASHSGSIVLRGAEGQMLHIFDIQGRMIISEKVVEGRTYTMPTGGIYLVQIGHHPAQRVVVR